MHLEFQVRHETGLVRPFEVLDGTFVLLGGFPGGKRTEIAPLAGMGVGLTGVEPVFAGF